MTRRYARNATHRNASKDKGFGYTTTKITTKKWAFHGVSWEAKLFGGEIGSSFLISEALCLLLLTLDSVDSLGRNDDF